MCEKIQKIKKRQNIEKNSEGLQASASNQSANITMLFIFLFPKTLGYRFSNKKMAKVEAGEKNLIKYSMHFAPPIQNNKKRKHKPTYFLIRIRNHL